MVSGDPTQSLHHCAWVLKMLDVPPPQTLLCFRGRADLLKTQIAGFR